MGPLDFFSTLFGDTIGSDHKLVLWEPRTKRSYWHSSLPDATTCALELSAHVDCYFGCLLQHASAWHEDARGGADTTSVFGGVWIDIDIDNETRKKAGLPKDEAQARKFISELPLPPSLILRTGGGFHAWWALKEPYAIESNSERDAIIAPTVYGWQKLCRERAGFTIDSTHDLARVMRVPGTRNHKYGVDVTLVSDRKKRPAYNVSDFEQWRCEPPTKREIAGVAFSINAKAVVPTDKVLMLTELDPKFAATWNHRRADFKSQSEYDFSLGSTAVHAGFSDQEIIDLLVAHRRAVNNDDPKIERHDYFARTIGKLRAEKQRVVQTEQAAVRVQEIAKAPETQSSRSDMMTNLSAMLGFQVDRLIKFNCDPPVYRLETPNGKIQLGSVDSLLMFGRFRSKVAAATGEIMPRPARGQWEPMSKALLASVEIQDLGDASEDGGGALSWVREYLNSIEKLSTERNESTKSRSPWIESDHVWFFSEQLRTFLAVRSIRLPFNELSMRLRNAGAHPRTVAAKRKDGGSTTVRVWGIPVSSVDLQYRVEAKEPINGHEAAPQ